MLFKLCFHAFLERREGFPPVWRITTFFLCPRSPESPCKSFWWGGRERQSSAGEAPSRRGGGMRMAGSTAALVHALLELYTITEPLQHRCSVKEWHEKAQLLPRVRGQNGLSSLHGTCFECLGIKRCLSTFPLLSHATNPTARSWTQRCNAMKTPILLQLRKDT